MNYKILFSFLFLLWIGISKSGLRNRRVLLPEYDGAPPPPVELMDRSRSERLEKKLEEGLRMCCCPLEDRLDNAEMQARCVAWDMHLALLSYMGGLGCCKVGAGCPPPVGPVLMVCGGVSMCAGGSLCVADSARRVYYIRQRYRNRVK